MYRIWPLLFVQTCRPRASRRSSRSRRCASTRGSFWTHPRKPWKMCVFSAPVLASLMESGSPVRVRVSARVSVLGWSFFSSSLIIKTFWTFVPPFALLSRMMWWYTLKLSSLMSACTCHTVSAKGIKRFCSDLNFLFLFWLTWKWSQFATWLSPNHFLYIYLGTGPPMGWGVSAIQPATAISCIMYHVRNIW